MFDKNTYIQRREALKKKGLKGIILIPGNDESPMNYPANTFHFRQDSNFLYFFGLDFPGLAGIIDVDSGEDWIFGNDVEIEDIIWMGPQVPLKENAIKAGIQKTAPFGKLYDFIQLAISQGRKVHFTPPYRGESMIMLEKHLGISPSRLKEYASVELIKAIVELRSIKEPAEIEEIKKACAVGYDMYVSVMKMAQPGVCE